MAIRYRKTPKGVDEVQTRAHRLPPRARGALILVDGQRTDEELARLIPVQAAETLAALAEAGFIEVIAGAPVPAAPAPPPPARQPDFKLVQREAVRRLVELVGPSGDDLAIRMEAARSMDQLRPLLVHARSLIGNVRGAQPAADYIAALSAL
ncbi:MAG: hypothetical protein JNN18_21960 [Rubrivivax sp.]|jgi:hypothetical protein|nr:hypothetical protein [Rubrivivax sp.]